MEGLKPGRIVYFVFDEQSANEVNRRRTTRSDIATGIALGDWPIGAQAHLGNEVHPGDVLPAMVVRVWDQSSGCSNLKVVLDGSDNYWATSVTFNSDKSPRSWHWMYEGQATRGEAK